VYQFCEVDAVGATVGYKVVGITVGVVGITDGTLEGGVVSVGATDG
jgi:uncharacterized membrane protein